MGRASFLSWVYSNSSVGDHCLGVGEDGAASLIGTDAELDRDRQPVVGDLQPMEAVRRFSEDDATPG
jgi:hypothetical protein